MVHHPGDIPIYIHKWSAVAFLGAVAIGVALGVLGCYYGVLP